MWRMLESKTAQVIGTWFGILSGAGSLLSWLTPEWFGQLSIPQAIFVGIGFALGVSLVGAIALAIAGYGFRLFKPLKAHDSLPELDHSPPGIDSEELIERFTGEMDHLKEYLREMLQTIGSNHDALQDRINAIEDVQSQNAEAFLAIYHRERMLALATRIDRESLELGKPLAEGKVMNEEEWTNWKSSALQWESVVHQWAQWAAFYSGRNPMDDIKRINVEGLDENWGAKPDQFPDPEGLRVYKTFRIYVRNWANINKVVHEKVRRKAFEGVSV